MISLACEKADHTNCYRSTCDCHCGHPGRLSDEDRARLEARPAPTRRAAPKFEHYKRGTRAPKKKQTAAPRPPRAPRVPRPVKVVDIDEARRLYETERLSMRAIAERFGVAHTRIRAELAAAGVTIRRQGDRTVALPDDEIEARYLAGESLEDLGRAYNVASTTIRGHLHKRGVPIRDIRAARAVDLPITDDELAHLYTDRFISLRDLGIRFGVSEQTITRRLRAHGVTIRPRVRPGRANRSHAARVTTNGAGQRICPECRTTVLVRKNPHGPGRYPARCEACKAARAAA